MTSLRTSDGLNLAGFENQLMALENGRLKNDKLIGLIKKYEDEALVRIEDGKLILTRQGKLFADGIASKLFVD